MNGLTERRAAFVYEAARLQAIASGAPVVPEPWEDREVDFRLQFLATIERQCGPDRFTSPQAAHESWVVAYTEMGWVYGPVRDRVARTHPDLVPFEALEQREQDKDAVFLALCDIARQWIREPASAVTGQLAYCGMREDGTPAVVPADLAGYCGPGCHHCGPYPTLTLQNGVWVCAADYDQGD